MSTTTGPDDDSTELSPWEKLQVLSIHNILQQAHATPADSVTVDYRDRLKEHGTPR